MKFQVWSQFAQRWIGPMFNNYEEAQTYLHNLHLVEGRGFYIVEFEMYGDL